MLSGFGCRILAYDKFPNEEVKKYAIYVDGPTQDFEHLAPFDLKKHPSWQIRNQSTPKSFLLNLSRYLPGIDNQPVYLDEPSHGVVSHPAWKRPMRVRLPGLQQIHDRRRFRRACFRAEAKVLAQLVRPQVWRLALVKEKVDPAHRVNNATGPGLAFAGGDRRRTLAAQRGRHASAKIPILLV